MDAKKLRELCDGLFGKRSTLLNYWQEIAENFYPQRADFTFQRQLGIDFAGGLTTSYPVMVARDFQDQIGSMLRQSGKPWFHMGVRDMKRVDTDAKRWMEWAEGVQRRAMYDRKTLFATAVKQGDADFGVFGQYAMSVEINWRAKPNVGPHLLYRCHHLRDMAWKEDESGDLCLKVRKWKPTVRDLIGLFGEDAVDEKVKQLNQQDKIFEEVNCYHIVCDMEMYDGPLDNHDRGRERFPRVSLYYDVDHDKMMRAEPILGRHYIIPRWQTVSGSQYAFSPAVIAGLPEARLLQAMAYTLLEAGEKAASPPMIATADAVRSDIDLQAGGVTWVDLEYDERLGEALRPLTIDTRGLPVGLDMQRDSRSVLLQAFYANKLRPFAPTSDPQMTAFQAGQIVSQYIRDALPLFEPMETEINGQICEESFELLMRGGAFGSPFDLPKSLQGEDIEWSFESPLHDAIEQMKGQKFMELKTFLAEALALDKSVAAIPDIKVAFRDALRGVGVPAEWTRSEADVERIIEDQQQQDRSAQMLAQLEQGAGAAADLAAAQKSQAEAHAVTAGA